MDYKNMTEIIDWANALSDCKYDENVGIRIAKLTGDEKFSTFITIIDAGKHVNPHYHKHGIEHYHIIEGNGEITLKKANSDDIESIMSVNAGQSFVVYENIIHKLTNTGNNRMVLMFSCPATHLETDRFLA
jgi:mannose-6-phosphate isomerase-like protein (cupin superfamily)